MVITEIPADEVVRSSREALGLPVASRSGIDDAMLSASLRRAAGTLCPCSPSTLVTAVLESLRYLIKEDITTQDRIDAAAEALIIGGDLLELNQVTTDDPDVKGTWVFLAPPGFVVRPDGSIFLLGVAPDEITPLPASLSARITYEGYARVLTPEPAEALPAVLRDLGLVELSRSAWLKTPKVESATELRDSMLRRLRSSRAAERWRTSPFSIPPEALATIPAAGTLRTANPATTLRGGRRRMEHLSGDLPKLKTESSLSSLTFRCREHAGEGAMLHGIYRWRSITVAEHPNSIGVAAILRAPASISFPLCRYGPSGA
jgi:hypothetical protein